MRSRGCWDAPGAVEEGVAQRGEDGDVVRPGGGDVGTDAAVLRRLLPVGAARSPVAHQRLLAALDPTQVRTAAPVHQSQGVLAKGHCPVPSSVRALAVDPRRLVTRVTRAG